MGTWGTLPWENDSGADWYSEFMEKTDIRTHVIDALKLDINNNYDEIHAAIGIFIMLGHNYIWPIGSLDEDLKKIISKTEELLEIDVLKENAEIIETIKMEIAELKSRQTNNKTNIVKPNKPWWQFWK